MDPDLELFIPILEILESKACNILYNPGNISELLKGQPISKFSRTGAAEGPSDYGADANQAR